MRSCRSLLFILAHPWMSSPFQSFPGRRFTERLGNAPRMTFLFGFLLNIVLVETILREFFRCSDTFTNATAFQCTCWISYSSIKYAATVQSWDYGTAEKENGRGKEGCFSGRGRSMHLMPNTRCPKIRIYRGNLVVHTYALCFSGSVLTCVFTVGYNGY